ncbi:MAG TPA: hypothetical protein PK156_26915 [Polyangium sp.]|nr:hypothetical protein [Polyangium sp.]
MSFGYSLLMVRGPHDENAFNKRFRPTKAQETDWLICEFTRGAFPDGIFEGEELVCANVVELASEVVYIGGESSQDQFHYEHVIDSEVVRKLVYSSDGCETTWISVEGTEEPWEAGIFFSEHSMQRVLDIYDDDRKAKLEPELKSAWAEHRYGLEKTWPSCDATVGFVVAKSFGIDIEKL